MRPQVPHFHVCQAVHLNRMEQAILIDAETDLSAANTRCHVLTVAKIKGNSMLVNTDNEIVWIIDNHDIGI